VNDGGYEITEAILELGVLDQSHVDKPMLDLDGTPQKITS